MASRASSGVRLKSARMRALMAAAESDSIHEGSAGEPAALSGLRVIQEMAPASIAVRAAVLNIRLRVMVNCNKQIIAKDKEKDPATQVRSGLFNIFIDFFRH